MSHIMNIENVVTFLTVDLIESFGQICTNIVQKLFEHQSTFAETLRK